MTRMPIPAKRDPMFNAKQDREAYRGAISDEQVMYLTTLLLALRSENNRPVYHPTQGPRVRDWLRDGYTQATSHAEALILDGLLAEGQPFAGMLQRYSLASAHYYTRAALFNIRQCINVENGRDQHS